MEEGDAHVNAPVITPSSSTESVNKVPVVKAKATHIIMNSLITSKSSAFCEISAFCSLVVDGRGHGSVVWLGSASR